jgi:biotin carboxyl carrier protein
MATMRTRLASGARASWPALVIGVVLGSVVTTSAEAQTPATRLSLDEAVRLATRDNPGLRAKQLEVRATRANEVTAALRPNPVADFSAEQLGGRSFPTTDAIPQYTISISQLIETGGKRQRRIDSAKAATSVTGYELADLRRQLVAQVKKAFTAILLAQEALALARANLINLDEVERTNRTSRVLLPVPGRIVDVMVKLGDAVERGQPSPFSPWRAPMRTARSAPCDRRRQASVRPKRRWPRSRWITAEPVSSTSIVPSPRRTC